jgi:type IV pilus assembly protein PilQ
MNTLRRILLLGLFVGTGAVVAVGLALSTGPDAIFPFSISTPNVPVPAGISPAEVPANVERGAIAAGDAMPDAPAPAPPIAIVQPQIAPAQPIVAQQADPPTGEATMPISAVMQVLKAFTGNDSTQAAKADDDNVAQNESSTDDSSTQSVTNQGNLILNFTGTDIRKALELISKGAGINILATKEVTGTVTCSLHDVDGMTALASILKSTGYVAHQEGNIIYVGKAEEFATPGPALKVVTRVYRPNYVTAEEIQKLITPMLTLDIGVVSVSSPAETGIASDSASAGGDGFANAEVVLVRDYVHVLEEIDQVVRLVDKKPMQVAIEAMILSVKIDDTTKLGVNFDLLKDHIRVISGTPPATIGAIAPDGGLKVGFMDSSLTALVEALETIGDTNVIATPRLLAVNKHKAEILIGSELGYVSSTVTETSLTQSVEFLEVGTSLRIRPFISSDGQIRMEVHPELSTGSVRVEEGFTLPDKETTQVTTNIIARDGSTVIIGGLIREDLVSNTTQIPFFGSLPVLGPAFRQKTEDIDRREILVLITPHILYDPEASYEGDLSAMEFHHRQAVKFKHLSPLSSRRLGVGHLRRAQVAWANGNFDRALRHANLAIHYDPQNRAAIDLRADVVNGAPTGDHNYEAPFTPLPNGRGALDGSEIAPWVLDGLDPAASPDGMRLHPWDPGRPGPRSEIKSTAPESAAKSVPPAQGEN